MTYEENNSFETNRNEEPVVAHEEQPVMDQPVAEKSVEAVASEPVAQPAAEIATETAADHSAEPASEPVSEPVAQTQPVQPAPNTYANVQYNYGTNATYRNTSYGNAYGNQSSMYGNQSNAYGTSYGQPPYTGPRSPYVANATDTPLLNTPPRFQPEKKSKKKTESKGFPWVKLTALMLVCVLAGGLVGGIVSWKLTESTAVLPATPSVNTQMRNQNEAPKVTAEAGKTENGKALLTPRQIGEHASAAVVAINTTAQVRSLFGNIGTVEGAGSGVLISPDGYILTNNHVINNSQTITVNLANGKSYPAKVIGQDRATDIAVIKIDAKNLPYMEMGDSSKVKMGDMVVAIGNPLGELEGSLTVGYISATNRNVTVKEDDGSVTTMYGLLQTDAAINRGNSGGALISMTGELIGINTVKTSAVGVEGLGFAIPTNSIKPIVEDLMKYGKVKERPTLGITGLGISSEMVQEYDYPMGVYVRSVIPNGPAAKAGVKRGDIITKVNNEKVASVNDINALKTQFRAGEQITLTVWRSGETLEIKLTLGKASDEQPQQTQPQQGRGN